MDDCKHSHLVLLPKPSDRVRCRQCHLTIKIDDLTGKYCPECYEMSGKRHNDFEEVEETPSESVQYRCEDCGVLINC